MWVPVGRGRLDGMRAETATIDGYLRVLGDDLRGPRRLKADLLREARHGLVDAAAAYREDGLCAADAERRAVAEFGGVDELAPAYQAELATGAARRLALWMILVPALFAALADFMWWGAPWTASATPPPGGYQLIAEVQDHLGYGYAGLAVAASGWLAWCARHGRPAGRFAVRGIGLGALAVMGLGWLAGVVMFTWSVRLWDGVLMWPPMLVGSALIMVIYACLAHSAVQCLRTVR